MKIKYSKGWSTYYAVVIKTIQNCQGNVLEYGAGFFSTPLLHWLCKDLNKKLVTLESNKDFFRFAYQFRSRFHRISLVENWDNIPVRGHWGVILIDHDQPYQRRGKDAIKFKNNADYIILHDSEEEKIYGYDKIWKHFKYRFDWKECRPWTTVVSNFQDLSWLQKEEEAPQTTVESHPIKPEKKVEIKDEKIKTKKSDKLSVIIPSYNEPYLNKTISDLLEKAEGEIEVLVNIDGKKPKNLIKDDRIRYFHHSKPIGMRGGVNIGLEHASGKFIMKTDAHCAFAKGFDTVLKRDCKRNWLMIPRRYSLLTDKWDRQLNRPIRDYHYFAYPTKDNGYAMPCPDWPEMTNKKIKDPKYSIDDTMSFQGSCWFANRAYFMKKVGYLNDKTNAYTPYSGEQLEIGLKYWLTEGKVKVNKNTWYAHLFKNSNYYKHWKLGRKVKISATTWKGHRWAAKHWLDNKEPKMKHKFSWLLEKFWPVPGWPEDKKLWKVIKK